MACVGTGALILAARNVAVDPCDPVHDVFDGGLDQLRQLDLGLDGDLGRRDLGVAAVLPRRFAAEFDYGETARGWCVVAEDVERVLAGVEAALPARNLVFVRTADDLAFVAIRLANLVLEIDTFEAGAEALVGGDDGRRGGGFGGLLRRLLGGWHAQRSFQGQGSPGAARKNATISR